MIPVPFWIPHARPQKAPSPCMAAQPLPWASSPVPTVAKWMTLSFTAALIAPSHSQTRMGISCLCASALAVPPRSCRIALMKILRPIWRYSTAASSSLCFLFDEAYASPHACEYPHLMVYQRSAYPNLHPSREGGRRTGRATAAWIRFQFSPSREGGQVDAMKRANPDIFQFSPSREGGPRRYRLICWAW